MYFPWVFHLAFSVDKCWYKDSNERFCSFPFTKLCMKYWDGNKICFQMVQFSAVAQSCPTLRPHESQHARPARPSPTPGVHSDSHPSSPWCHPAISSSVVPFFSCPQSLPASESFPTLMSQLFTWSGQSIGLSASASFLPVNTQDWSPLGWTGWISS